MAKPPNKKTVDAIRHGEATRRNIPTAEFQSVLSADTKEAVKVTLPRGV